MGVCRHVVVEESLPVGGQERHKPVAAVSHIGKRLHLRRRAVDDALHLIVALYAERAARNALITYLLQRIVGIAVPRVVYLFYNLRVPQVLEDILTVEPSGEVALLLIPVRIVEVVYYSGSLGGMLLAEVLPAERARKVSVS